MNTASVDDLNKADGKASLMAGTPEYLSPEQVKGLAATPRTDLYGVGVLLFEMVTGQLPFKSDSVLELLNAHRITEAPRAGTRVSQIPPMLEDLIASCLEKQPELRPSSADSARQTVQRILRNLKEGTTRVTARPSRPPTMGPLAAPVTTRQSSPELSRGLPQRTWLVGAAVLISVAGIVLATRPGPSPKDVVPPQAKVVAKVEVSEVAPEGTPPKPAVIAPREDARDSPPPRKGPRVVVAPKPVPIPEACAGRDDTWKPLLTRAYDEADQGYTSKMQGQTDPVADKELFALRGKIKALKSQPDCVQLMASLRSWQKKWNNPPKP